ncbi:MAG: 30S ribosomal protein S12 methylthiotransferase RimO [Planctomycetota bacterium]|nr:30S ribosomal protein S12 methylthiotransferase RimO [Planctomycetota bacterium]
MQNSHFKPRLVPNLTMLKSRLLFRLIMKSPETIKNPSTAEGEDIKSVAFVSLGCPKNLVDSEKMLGTLAQTGYRLVTDHAEADAIVVNTCGFLDASKEESLDVIHEAIERKNKGEIKRVIVAGCLVQRHRAKMLEWAPGIDAMIGVFDRDHIIEAVSGTPSRPDLAEASDRPKYWIAGNALQAAKARGLETVGLTVQGADGKGIGYFEDDSNRLRLTPRHWAYLRVSEGCNQKCTFCTIPSIRGKMRSKAPDVIVSEARALIADGAFELNLIGQDTTSFGYDIGYEEGLIGLLTSLDKVAQASGGGWMRLMYVYPTHFTDAMIDAIASLPNIVKYIDIPLQHMSDNMLGSMRRNITRDEQETLLHKLRDRIPGLAIRTTMITGFPGETQEDHEQLLEFIEDFGFDAMGVFKYSHEEGTPAGTMDKNPDLHVPEEIKIQREAELMLAQQTHAFENAAYIAQERCQFDVLIEGPASGGTEGLSTPGVSEAGKLYSGRCYHQAPQVDSMTYVHSESKLSPGELVRCTIVDADGYDLIARPTEQLDQSVSLPILS